MAKYRNPLQQCHICQQYMEDGWGKYYTMLQIVPEQDMCDAVVSKKWVCDAFADSCVRQLREIYIVDEIGLDISPSYAIQQLETLDINPELTNQLKESVGNWLRVATKELKEEESIYLWLPRFELRHRQARLLFKLGRLREDLEYIHDMQNHVPLSSQSKSGILLFQNRLNTVLQALNELQEDD